MSDHVERMLRDAMNLSTPERAELAARLIESLEGRFDEQVEAEWDAEIAQRVADLSSGAVKTTPWPEVRNRLMGRVNDAAA